MRKSRIVSLITACAVTTAALFAGTYAWRSVTQEATNEVLGSLNPGGRLHDDFNGMNVADGDTKVKNVYVENFTTNAANGANIYARIKFYEYLEKGEDAGAEHSDSKKAKPLVTGTNIKDEENWTPYKWDDASIFRKYVTLNLGGATKYLPTYNMDKDSLEAEVNGTLEGKDGTPYGDYVDYTAKGVGTVVNGVEIYALDDQGIDEVSKVNLTAQKIIDAIMDPSTGAAKSTISKTTTSLDIGTYTGAKVRVVEDDSSRVSEIYLDLWDAENSAQTADGVEDIKVVIPETAKMHKVKETLTAGTSITMAEWIAGDQTPGNYWVLDEEDGWAYWASPIASESATGCLLNSISLVDGADIDGDFYYALNVVAQFATAGDWNTNVEGAGFKTGDITENAVTLLNKISTPAPTGP